MSDLRLPHPHAKRVGRPIHVHSLMRNKRLVVRRVHALPRERIMTAYGDPPVNSGSWQDSFASRHAHHERPPAPAAIEDLTVPAGRTAPRPPPPPPSSPSPS